MYVSINVFHYDHITKQSNYIEFAMLICTICKNLFSRLTLDFPLDAVNMLY